MGLLDGKANPHHRRPHRRLAGLRGGPAGPGGGGRRRALGRRAGPVADPAHGPQAARRARRPRDRRDRARPAGGGRRRSWPTAGTASTACCTPSASRRRSAWAGTCSGADWDDVAVALHISTYSLKALVEAFRPLLVAAGTDGRRRLGGRARLRRHGGLARLRLDGRGQGRPRVAVALPGPRARPRGDPGQPGGGRAGAHHGGQVDPGLQRLRGHLGGPGARSAGTCTTPTPVARACVALFSDLFPMTTGEILHVDGGVHAVGA